MIGRLCGPRVKDGSYLQRSPYPPIKIIGPRGVGKTTLLTWIQREATKKGVCVVRCAYLNEKNSSENPMQDLLATMAGGEPKLRDLIKDVSVSLAGIVNVALANDKSMTYESVVREIMKKEPLLLLLDEVQHYGLEPLAELLQKSQQLISEGWPLGIVLAGTPMLDSHLRKAKSTFIIRSKKIYINTICEKATLEALREPFVQNNVAVSQEALEAMAAQTDNYPYFIQLVGEAVWEAKEDEGRTKIDIELVKAATYEAREGREDLYEECYDRMRDNNLLEQARKVMDVLEKNDGEVDDDKIFEVLSTSSNGFPVMLYSTIRETFYQLREDGFIWTMRGKTRPGIPSFFSYFKTRQQKEGRFM